MKFRMPGATALAALMVAVAAPAPLAFAQQGGAQVQVSREIAQPLNEARTAIQAKDWATAKSKLDAATAKAKTPADKGQIDRLRVYVAAQTNDGAAQLAGINALIASGTLTPEESKQYKGALAKAYLDAGDQAGSLKAFGAYINEFGGTPDQYIGIANDYAKANDYANAITWATKAIDAAKANGTPQEAWYRLLASAHRAQKQMPEYYAVREATLIAHPNSQNAPAYWQELIARVQEEPGFGTAVRLDMFRALQAAGVKLPPEQLAGAANEAVETHGLPNDAVQLLDAGVSSGEITVQGAKELLAKAKSQAANDKAGLAKETADVLAKGDGAAIATIGEAHLSYGDYPKAIEVLQAAIAKGISDPGDLALAKLHLGIAQFRAGQADAARSTWAEVTPGNATGTLAHAWTLISKVKA